MKFKETKIKGLYIIEPELKIDERGYFARIFCKKELKKIGFNFDIVQINRSLNKKKGIIRGMHFQKPPKAEDKIVQCIKGAIYDVAVDLRKGSRTFGQWVAEELTEHNKKMFLIPKGFAHGSQSLKDNSEILYFLSEFYSPEYESGVRWDDPFFNIKWPIKNPILSEKDKNWLLINP
jgi:dTDP-4-dehydrorhamnose 3,5-epimerase